jgi:hypothetical protein
MSLKKIIVLAVLVVFAKQLYAQKTKEFQGNVVLENGDSANVVYTYLENKGKRTLQGDFTLKSARLMAHDSIQYLTGSWKGSFDKGLKNGNWIYTADNHLINIKGVKDFNVLSSLKTISSELRASYNRGIPEGTWEYNQNSFLKGENARSIATAKLQFSKGMLSGKVAARIEDRSYPIIIRGQVNENGFLHGSWSLNYKQDSIAVQETRIYENGFLLDLLRLSVNNSIDTLSHIQWDQVREALANKDQNLTIYPEKFPLLFDIGYAENAPEIVEQEIGNEIMRNILRDMLFLDTAFVNNPPRILGTARFLYKMDKEETTLISSMSSYPDTAQHILQQIRNKKFFELNNQRSDTLAWSYDYLKKYSQKLVAWQKVITFIRGEAYPFVDPAIYFAQQIPFLKPVDTLYYNYDGESKRKVINYSVNTIHNIKTLHARMLEEEKLIKEIVQQCNVALDKVLKSDKLDKMETILLTAFKEVEEEYAIEEKDPAGLLIHAWRKQFLDIEFNKRKHNYTSSDNYDEKESLLYENLNFLSDLKPLPKRIQRIYEVRDSIDQLYTQSKLDPYTFNTVETKVKRKLYDKVAVELFDYLQKGLTIEKELEQLTNRLTQVELLQQRLFQFRDTNTTALERQLKSKTEPEEVKTIIQI